MQMGGGELLLRFAGDDRSLRRGRAMPSRRRWRPPRRPSSHPSNSPTHHRDPSHLEHGRLVVGRSRPAVGPASRPLGLATRIAHRRDRRVQRRRVPAGAATELGSPSNRSCSIRERAWAREAPTQRRHPLSMASTPVILGRPGHACAGRRPVRSHRRCWIASRALPTEVSRQWHDCSHPAMSAQAGDHLVATVRRYTVPSPMGNPRASSHQSNRPRPAAVVDVGRGCREPSSATAQPSRNEREGRILDAAFVLADLLNRTGEACSFLGR
jgi:hypothetical protein